MIESGRKRLRPTVTWHVDPHLCGLLPILEEGLLSDITIQLADGTDTMNICAHRVLLSAASDMLKAKFTRSFADSATQVWSPEVGSVKAWRWLIGWIYGKKEPLPKDIFVEMLVLADHLQIHVLVQRIKALTVGHRACDVAGQLLDVWACPDALTDIAEKCVPYVTLDRAVLSHLQAAELPNVALFIKHIPNMSDKARLRLIGASLNSPDGTSRHFSDCLLGIVSWDTFSADVLEAALADDFKYFEDFLGHPISSTAAMKTVLLKALANRCRSLERQAETRVSIALPLCVPSPDTPQHGLFSKLQRGGCRVEVLLSSIHGGSAPPLPNLFCLAREVVATKPQSPTDQPWIEVRVPAGQMLIKPDGIGLMHGWPLPEDICQEFVVEGARKDGQWHTLLNVSDRPLSRSGMVFRIPKQASTGSLFTRFRIQMTGPTSSRSWALLIGWFEVFGTVASSVDWDMSKLLDEPS